MRSAFADLLVPMVPLDFMYGPNMTLYFFHIFVFFNSTDSYQIASIFDM